MLGLLQRKPLAVQQFGLRQSEAQLVARTFHAHAKNQQAQQRTDDRMPDQISVCFGVDLILRHADAYRQGQIADIAECDDAVALGRVIDKCSRSATLHLTQQTRAGEAAGNCPSIMGRRSNQA